MCAMPFPPTVQVLPLSVRYGMDRSQARARQGVAGGHRPEHDKEGRVVMVGSSTNQLPNPSPHPSLQVLPLSVRYGIDRPEHDKEGRVVTVEFAPFFLVCCYTPNSSEKLVRLVGGQGNSTIVNVSQG
ncbi:unnamed protein product [Closterium sp. NIES-53]